MNSIGNKNDFTRPPSGEKNKEAKNDETQTNTTAHIRAHVLGEAFFEENPISQVEEGIKLPTGRFFCTHTIKRKDLDLQKNEPLKMHYIVELKLNSTIEQQVRQKFLSKKMTEASQEIISPEQTKPNAQQSEIPNLCESFKSKKKAVKELKKTISDCEKKIENAQKASYSGIRKEFSNLANIEEAQKGLALFEEEYTTLAERINKLKNWEIKEGVTVTTDQIKEVENIEKELKNLNKDILSKLNGYYGSFNKNGYSLSNGKLSTALNNLKESVKKFKNENTSGEIGYKSEAQAEINTKINFVHKEVLTLKEQLNKVNKYKSELEKEAEQIIPPYIKKMDSINRQLDLMNQYRPLKKSEIARQRMDALKEGYAALEQKIESLINPESQSDGDKDPTNFFKEDIKKLKSIVKDLNSICRSLQANNSLKNLTMSFKKEHLDALDGWVSKLENNSLSKEGLKIKLLPLFEEASKNLSTLTESLIEVEKVKKELEGKGNAYEQLKSLQEDCFEELFKQIDILSSNPDYSFEHFKEASDNLKKQNTTTLGIIETLAKQLTEELQQGKEDDKFDPKIVDQLIEQVNIVSLFFGDQEKTISNIKRLLEDLKGLEKREDSEKMDAFRTTGIAALKAIFEFKNKQLDEEVKKLGDKAQKKQQNIAKNLEEAKQSLQKAKKEKAEIIKSFLDKINLIEGNSEELSEELKGEIQEAQKLVKELLVEYRLHSLNRFSNLFLAHRNFANR